MSSSLAAHPGLFDLWRVELRVISYLLYTLSCVVVAAAVSETDLRHSVVESGSTWVDVCKWKSFEVDCSSDAVVFIDQARYGRMRLGSCLTTGYGHVGCFADVTRYVEARCAGRHRCSLQIPDVDLERSSHNCPHELLTYLEVEYHCQPVLTANDQNCTDQPIPLVAPPSESFIASIVTQETNRGSKSCPWLFNSTEGQIVTFSLLDFAAKPLQNAVLSSLSNETYGEVCIIYAEISDRSASGEQRKMLVCGGNNVRDTVVYTSGSTGGVTHLTIHASASSREVFFLVRITVRCRDTSAPSNDVIIDCPTVRESHMSTEDCSSDDVNCVRSPIDMPHSPVFGADAAPYNNQGLLIVVVIGTALFLSFSIIAVGLVCLRNRSRNDSRLSAYHSACIYDMPPHNTAVAHYPLSSGSDGYRSVLAASQTYKDLYPVLSAHDRLAADRDYATTLQMRQTANQQSCMPCSLSSPDVWACPVHGHVTLGTLPARRSLRHHPLRLPSGGERFYEVTTSPVESPSSREIQRGFFASHGVPPDSPFYHELDPNAFGIDHRGQHPMSPGMTSPSTGADNNNVTQPTSTAQC